MSAVKARGETDFSQAGEGVILLFRNRDLKVIEEKLGDGYFAYISDRALKGTISIAEIELLLANGAKGQDRQPVKVDEDVLDKIPLYDLGDKLLDALTMSLKGVTFKAHVDETMKMLAEMAESGDPEPPLTASPEPSSTGSGNGASAPA